MKPFFEVESNRVQYHKFSDKNTVHRSSLLVPRFEHTKTNISFLNHFLIKRNISHVILKITSIDTLGNSKDASSFKIDAPKVYSLNLEELFDDCHDVKGYIVEFYSAENLYFPFPAVMINHIGSDFVNTVHSFNRILNDVFEDDQVNKIQVYESSIDVWIDKEYDTFFNFAAGPFKVSGNLSVTNSGSIENKSISPDAKRLTNKNYYLSNLFDKELTGETILRILQPKQPLFYGRLLSGIMNKKTKAFSANHSYYDSSSTEEYFDNHTSFRAYPFFPDCLNKITMYPIMSPSVLNVYIELCETGKTYKSDVKTIRSPSSTPISFDVNKLVRESGIFNVTSFRVVAQSTNDKIPTRVNHQLIYGSIDPASKLKSSINVSLLNDKIFTPRQKPGLTWGQVLLNNHYESRLGICFNNNFGESDEVLIDFYSQNGLLNSMTQDLSPNNAIIFDNQYFDSISTSDEFLWYLVKSKRPDISAASFHYHRDTGNASGEHSF